MQINDPGVLVQLAYLLQSDVPLLHSSISEKAIKQPLMPCMNLTLCCFFRIILLSRNKIYLMLAQVRLNLPSFFWLNRENMEPAEAYSFGPANKYFFICWLPSQSRPSPEKPILHEHTNEPITSVHTPLPWQSWLSPLHWTGCEVELEHSQQSDQNDDTNKVN